MSKKIFISIVFCLFIFDGFVFAGNVTSIDINVNRPQGLINKKIVGNNLIGYDPMTYENWAKEYYGYSDYGAGIWDSKGKVCVKAVINIAREASITVLRFPGGCGTHHYDWRSAVGEGRENFLFGIDEFLQVCKEIGAEPIFTLSFFTGDEIDKAELVKYLSSRSPKVKYFEVGNEDWHGDHQNIKSISPEDYAQRYLKYYNAMKAADSNIAIGAILYTPVWNKRIMDVIKDKIDFGIIHTYPSPGVSKEELISMDPKEIFSKTLAMLEYKFEETSALLRIKAGKGIPLAITEYNGGFVQEKPVPYRHCLGTALVNAELLRIFMKPESNVLMANYWDFCNEYWGMIANGFDGTENTLYNEYYKRPNYYVFEIYKKHFGEELISVDVDSESYEIKSAKIPYLSVNASRSLDRSKVYLMVVNKNLENGVTTTIRLKGFKPSYKGIAAVLNGPNIDSTNEENHNNVKVTEYKFDVEGQNFQFTFEPHSLTAIEITKRVK